MTTANEKLAKLAALDELAGAVATKIGEVEGSIPTKVSDIDNDSNFQTGEQVQSAIASHLGRVYKPSGTVLFAELPTLSEDLLGNVYDIKEAFVTTENFREGAGKKYPAGTNVAVVQDGDTIKFDALSGETDLSNYVEKDGSKQLSDENYSTDEKNKLEGVTAGATKTEASEIDGNIKINGVETPVVEIATDAEVSAMIAKHFPTTT